MTFPTLNDQNTTYAILVRFAFVTASQAHNVAEPIESELKIQVEYDMDEQGELAEAFSMQLSDYFARSSMARCHQYREEEGPVWTCLL